MLGRQTPIGPLKLLLRLYSLDEILHGYLWTLVLQNYFIVLLLLKIEFKRFVKNHRHVFALWSFIAIQSWYSCNKRIQICNERIWYSWILPLEVKEIWKNFEKSESINILIIVSRPNCIIWILPSLPRI